MTDGAGELANMDGGNGQCTLEQKEIIDKLYREHRAAFLRYAKHRLGSDTAAEIAVQDAFVTALNKPEELLASQSHVGWIYRVIDNKIMHMIRDKTAMMSHFGGYIDHDFPQAATVDYYSVIDDSTLASEEYRLLKRFYADGYRLKEIAAEQGLSLGACKMKIKRAREKLRKRLK